MKISAPTSSQFVIEPKSSDLKATLIFFAMIVLIIISVSVYLFGFVMAKDSTLICDRVANSPLQCHIKETFAIARTPKIKTFTGLTRSRLDRSKISYFADRYIQLQTQKTVLRVIPLPDREISFPLSNYFDLIFLSDNTKNAIVWQIDRFIGDRKRKYLRIKLQSYTFILIFCAIYFPILLVLLITLIFAILTREKYTFDKNTQTMIWFNQTLPFQPVEYQFNFSALKLTVSPANEEERYYTITLQSYNPTTVHCFYRGRDRDRASELVLLLQDFLNIKTAPM